MGLQRRGEMCFRLLTAHPLQLPLLSSAAREPLEQCFFFLFLNIYLFIYLAAQSLSRGTGDLRCSVQNLFFQLWHACGI